MRIRIFQIKVNPGRRDADPEAVQKLVDSISKVGLLNPITVDQEYTLIAGLHRLDAAKMLGWTEIECTISNLGGLQAELAEIDENFVRKDLSDAEFRQLLLRRKEIYEDLYPETKAGIAQAVGMNRAMGNNVMAPGAATLKPFVDDTAEKLGIAARTVREELQIAKNLSPEAQKIIQTAGTKVKKKDTIKISRLPMEQQAEAASQLVLGNMLSAEKCQPAAANLRPAEPMPVPPAPALEGYYATTRDSVADLKNPDKDRSHTPATFLMSFSFSLRKFCQNVNTFADDEYTAVFPALTQEHLNQLHAEISSVHTALDDLFNKIERRAHK